MVEEKAVVQKNGIYLNQNMVIEVYGDRAIFTRPELSVERVTYDFLTPAAAVGILLNILGPRGIKYVIKRIYVKNPIVYESVKTNECGSIDDPYGMRKYIAGKAHLPYVNLHDDRCSSQRMNQMLRDVSYLIEFRMGIDSKTAPKDADINKWIGMFVRRARTGACYQTPYFGQRQFPANFKLYDRRIPYVCPEELKGERKEELMFYGWRDRDPLGRPSVEQFFHAKLVDGILEVPAPGSPDIITE